MKKGAVPIPYIIALLLGIAVVAILGYWFFALGGQWGGEVTLQRCRTMAHTYCSSWKAVGYRADGDDPSIGWFAEKFPIEAHENCGTLHGILVGNSDTPVDLDGYEYECEELLAGA